METSLKLLGTLLVLTITLATAFNLINSFNQYTSIRVLADDLENLGQVMDSLKSVGSSGSWQYVTIRVPDGYELRFNNVSDELEVRGLEEFNIGLSDDLLYELNLSKGVYRVQVYYGPVKPKNKTVVFQ